MNQVFGHLAQDGHVMARAGFMPALLPGNGISTGESRQMFSRVAGNLENDMTEYANSLQRGEVTGEINDILKEFGTRMGEFQRGVLSTMTAFPVRENLEAEAKILVPMATPVRNRLPRTPGSGTASAWRQLTSLGGGWGINLSTVTTGASSATQTLGTTAGLVAGDTLYFQTTGAARVVSSVTNTTVVVLTATISTTTSEVVTLMTDQPGGVAPLQTFFAEGGAPAAHTSVYASKSSSYKLLGTYGSVSGFAAAAGNNFQNQIEVEKRNAIMNLLLNEENALINGETTSTAAPWGDGTTNLAFAGLVNLLTTANGVPTSQVQTAVGTLTTAHIDAQLKRQWTQGCENSWMLMNGQEILSLTTLAQSNGSILRVMATQDAGGVLGFTVTGYKHPVSGQIVPVLPSRFLQAGTILFGADTLPDGTPAADVDVLPQVQLPQLAPNEMIQGYTAQEIAPTTTAPQIYPFLVSVFEVLRLKGATVWGKSTGCTAVS